MYDIRNICIRTFCTNFTAFLNLMKTSNTYKLKQLSHFLFYAMFIKRNIGIQLLAQMHINCNALHYVPAIQTTLVFTAKRVAGWPNKRVFL